MTSSKHHSRLTCPKHPNLGFSKVGGLENFHFASHLFELCVLWPHMISGMPCIKHIQYLIPLIVPSNITVTSFMSCVWISHMWVSQMISFHIPTNIMSRITKQNSNCSSWISRLSRSHVKMIIYKLTVAQRHLPIAKSGVCTKTTRDIQGLGSFPVPTKGHREHSEPGVLNVRDPGIWRHWHQIRRLRTPGSHWHFLIISHTVPKSYIFLSRFISIYWSLEISGHHLTLMARCFSKSPIIPAQVLTFTVWAPTRLGWPVAWQLLPP